METVHEWLSEIEKATQVLEGSLARIQDGTSQAFESQLPGWTRGHVIVHLARNADGLRNLMLAARTGEPLRMYASPRTRDADIDTGTRRPPEVNIADAAESAHRFLVDARSMPADSWFNEVLFTSGTFPAPSFPAVRLLELRLQEVAIHHVDLDIGYDFTDIPSRVVTRFLEDFVDRRARQGIALCLRLSDRPGKITSSEGPAHDVYGTAADVLAWLAGRRSTTAEGDPARPELPPLS